MTFLLSWSFLDFSLLHFSPKCWISAVASVWKLSVWWKWFAYICVYLSAASFQQSVGIRALMKHFWMGRHMNGSLSPSFQLLPVKLWDPLLLNFPQQNSKRTDLLNRSFWVDMELGNMESALINPPVCISCQVSFSRTKEWPGETASAPFTASFDVGLLWNTVSVWPQPFNGARTLVLVWTFAETEMHRRKDKLVWCQWNWSDCFHVGLVLLDLSKTIYDNSQ